MNETIIKEIKSIYSSRTHNPKLITPEINIRQKRKGKKSFFNGVIDKLNIVIEKKDHN